MLFCIKVKPMHKEAESFSLMILLLLFPYYIRNCSEPTSKMLRISSVWRIRQINSKTALKMQAFYTCFLKFCLALNSYLYPRHNLNQ